VKLSELIAHTLNGDREFKKSFFRVWRQFAERQGDWVCMKCKNLNFSFRVVCNRCQLPKNESEMLYMEHMNNLKSLTMYNEMLQNQVINQGNTNVQLNNNNFNSEIFSPNPLGSTNAIYGNNNGGNGNNNGGKKKKNQHSNSKQFN
jgi:hypothetical protein